MQERAYIWGQWNGLPSTCLLWLGGGESAATFELISLHAISSFPSYLRDSRYLRERSAASTRCVSIRRIGWAKRPGSATDRGSGPTVATMRCGAANSGVPVTALKAGVVSSVRLPAANLSRGTSEGTADSSVAPMKSPRLAGRRERLCIHTQLTYQSVRSGGVSILWRV
jgi:hypothetical protein